MFLLLQLPSHRLPVSRSLYMPDDFELVRAYKNNYGLKRSGYAQVLEERGFLERTEDGRFIPTEEFKYYWR